MIGGLSTTAVVLIVMAVVMLTPGQVVSVSEMREFRILEESGADDYVMAITQDYAKYAALAEDSGRSLHFVISSVTVNGQCYIACIVI